jgi:hypothetical protein
LTELSLKVGRTGKDKTNNISLVFANEVEGTKLSYLLEIGVSLFFSETSKTD